MTAREAYFKAYMLSNKPMGMLFYMFNQCGFERMGNTQWLVFSKEEHEYNVGSMEDIEKNVNGFMFWNISKEGEEYITSKNKKLGLALSSVIFMQK
jgi:hypothetical protein